MVVPPPGFIFVRTSPDRAPIVVSLSGPCVCPKGATGKRLRDCCLKTAPLAVAPVSTRPPDAKTRYSHRKCYASVLGDCSTDISAEHYWSESVLRILAPGGMIDVPLKPDAAHPTSIPLRTFAPGILCRRHNSVLSPIDATGAWVFGALRSARSSTGGDAPRVRFVNGPAFERWLLKVASGTLASQKQPVPETWVRILFSEANFPEDWGLHMHVHDGEPLPSSAELRTDFARDMNGTIIAWETLLDEFRFVLTLGRLVHRAEDLGAKRIRRPSGLAFQYSSGEDYMLNFTWPGTCGPQVLLRRS